MAVKPNTVSSPSAIAVIFTVKHGPRDVSNSFTLMCSFSAEQIWTFVRWRKQIHGQSSSRRNSTSRAKVILCQSAPLDISGISFSNEQSSIFRHLTCAVIFLLCKCFARDQRVSYSFRVRRFIDVIVLEKSVRVTQMPHLGKDVNVFLLNFFHPFFADLRELSSVERKSGTMAENVR